MSNPQYPDASGADSDVPLTCQASPLAEEALEGEVSSSMEAKNDATSSAFSRRNFLRSAVAAVSTASVPLASSAAGARIPQTASPLPASNHFAEPVAVVLRINGKQHALALEPRVTLLDALRETIGLTGTKKGCDRGQCGACTVLVDGRRINSCLTLAIMHDGEEITTVEGLEIDGQLAPLQTAFMENDAFQCGYCTPGQLCSATALLTEMRAGDASYVSGDVRKPQHLPTEDEIRERMSGNLCRCGAYPNIVTAISHVAANIARSADADGAGSAPAA